jgi:hypothetical protein
LRDYDRLGVAEVTVVRLTGNARASLLAYQGTITSAECLCKPALGMTARDARARAFKAHKRAFWAGACDFAPYENVNDLDRRLLTREEEE